MYIVLYMVSTRKKYSKKCASKKTGKSKTLRKKNKSRKNQKKVFGGLFGMFEGPKKLVIKSGTEIYTMVKETYDADIHDKEGDFKRFVLINGNMIEDAVAKGFPKNLNYILIEGKVTQDKSKGEGGMVLKDDEIKLLKSFKDRNLTADKKNLIFTKDGNIIEKPEEDKAAEAAAEQEAAAKQAAAEQAAAAKQAAAEAAAAKQAAEQEAKQKAAEAAAEAALSPEERAAKATAKAAAKAASQKAAAKVAADNERLRLLSIKSRNCKEDCLKAHPTNVTNLNVCRAKCP